MIDPLARFSPAGCCGGEKQLNEICVQHGSNPRRKIVESPNEYLLITINKRSQRLSEAAMISQIRSFYDFHEFRIDPEKRLLLRNEKAVPLSPKAFDTLLLLIQNSARVVTKEELWGEVWHGTFTTDNNINVHVSKIRKALDQGRSGHQCIETIDKQGFRFACEVRKIENQAADFIPEQQTHSLVVADKHVAPEELHSSRDQDGLAEATEVGATLATQADKPVSVNTPSKAKRLIDTIDRYKLIISAALLILVAASLLVFSNWITFIPKPEPLLSLANPRKITTDGRAKPGSLVTDGSRLYFLEIVEANRVPFQMMITGGDLFEITVPFPSITLLDISPDQTELLIGSQLTQETELQLWVMSVLGGSPRSVGNLRGHAAAWSPDGKHIVYANGPKLYLADSDGAQSYELVDVPYGLSYNLCWSPNGSLIRFDVQDPRTRSTSLWEVNADGTNLHPLLPEWNKPAAERCGSWTPDGKYFLFQAMSNKTTSIWAIREKSAASSKTGHEPIRLIEGAPSYRSPVVSKDGKTLFVVGEMNLGELVRYDIRTKQWVRYLGGISADQIKFSSDGQQILYVTYPEGELWKSKVDGSNRQQLSFSPLRVYNAAWSPDGKQISFSAMEPGKGWKGYLISAEGGNPELITPENDNERVSGWTPDGNSLILTKGERVLGKTATYLFDLKTKIASEVPVPEGLFALNWSPKGDYISAVRSRDVKGLMLYDVNSKVWKELVNMNAAYRVWSRDGKYIYFRSIFRNDPAIFRVSVPDGKLERWATLKGLQQAAGAYGPWMGLAPDGSVLMLRDVGIQNIYAFDLQYR